MRRSGTTLLAAVTVLASLTLSGCASMSAVAGQARTSAETAPRISALSATAGALAGGDTITLTGEHLEAVDRVLFGGEESEQVRVIDDTTVDVVVPHSYTYTAGPVSVVVFASTQLPAVRSDVDLVYTYQVLTGVDRQLEYAFAHWDNYNLAEYGNFTDWGGDCMNFVSQTLVARGWATTDDWYNDAQEDWAPAFVAVPSFDDWLRSHPEYGAVQLSLAQRDQVKIGDIVVFDWDNDGSLDHAQIVSGIRVVDGQIKIYLVGHDIDTHYRDLDQALKTEGGPDATAYFWSLPPA